MNTTSWLHELSPWLGYSWPKILDLSYRHLLLSLPAVLIAVLLAVPLGYFAARHPRVGGVLLSSVTLLYCIPALPLLVIVPAIFLLPLRSPWTVIIALSIYGVALMVRTAADAFTAIDPDARLSARAMGLSRWQLFSQVDLPLAIPVLVAGLRVLMISTVSLATIGALIGVPGLGQLFTDGFKRGITVELFAGLVAVITLAVLLDLLCQALGWALTPWQRAGRKSPERRVGQETTGRRAVAP